MLHSKTIRLLACIIIITVLATHALAADTVYHGNVNSGIFHAPQCRYYNCKNCVKVFHSREQALEAGYRACKVCRP